MNRAVPAIGLVAENEVKETGQISEDILCVCEWVAAAALAAFSELKTHDAPPADASLPPEEDWRKVRPLRLHCPDTRSR